jgi:hypothetical protein
MSVFEKYTCHCGTETMLKKDGTPWKHETPEGVRCSVEVPEVETKENVYEFIMYANPTMVNDEAWHNTNSRFARSKASREGFHPIGDGVLVSQEEVGNKVRLVYEVPLEG